MAQPNGLNPNFPGRVTSAGYDANHAKGVCVTCVSTAGTTDTDVFGSTNGFKGTVTGVYLIAKDATAANITLIGPEGTYCTIAKGTSAGGLVGATSLSYTAISKDGTLKVDSSDNTGNAFVFITYKVLES